MQVEVPNRKLPISDAARHVGLLKSTVDKLLITGSGLTYIQLEPRVAYDVADMEMSVSEKMRSSISASALPSQCARAEPLNKSKPPLKPRLATARQRRSQS
jgi:hypothetical protein